MDLLPLNQTSKLPSKVYDIYAEVIESYKEDIIEHFVSKGNLANIPGFWDDIRNKLNKEGLQNPDNHSYTDANYLEGVIIETEHIIMCFKEVGDTDDMGMYSTFELLIK